jgi:hypothetical protein
MPVFGREKHPGLAPRVCCSFNGSVGYGLSA